MEEKTKFILISLLGIILAFLAVYFVDFPKYDSIRDTEQQIAQVNSNISTKKAYYQSVSTQVAALESINWDSVGPGVYINFTASPFYAAKMQYFFQTIAAASGITLGSVTYTSPATSVTASNSSVKVSTGTTQATTAGTSGYYSQLAGPVKKATFNVSVSGTYTQFNTFLSKMEGQTRIITIRSVALSDASASSTASQTTSTKSSTSTSSKVLTFQLVADAYTY